MRLGKVKIKTISHLILEIQKACFRRLNLIFKMMMMRFINLPDQSTQKAILIQDIVMKEAIMIQNCKLSKLKSLMINLEEPQISILKIYFMTCN